MYITLKSGHKREIISQPLYDTVAIQNVTTATLFSAPVSGTKTIADTNMRLAGQLPRPYLFHVNSIAVNFHLTATTSSIAIAEARELVQNGALSLVVGAKTALEVPVAWLVAGYGFQALELQASTATGAAAAPVWANNGLAGHIYKWPIKYRIVIDENENFAVTLNYRDATPNSANSVQVVLDGHLIRGIQ